MSSKRQPEQLPPSSAYRKARLYADADVEADLVALLRDRGVNIVSAHELGYESRDDEFQLAEAERQRRFLVTKHGRDFLNDQRFPMSKLKHAIIVLQGSVSNSDAYADVITHLLKGIVPFGEWFEGEKITLSATHITVKHPTVDGRIDCTHFELRGAQFVEVD